MGSIYKRILKYKETGQKVKEDTFWISYFRNGKQFRENTNTTSLVEAQLLLEKKESGISKGIPATPKAGRMKFPELVADIVKRWSRGRKKSKPEASQSQPEIVLQEQSSIERLTSAPKARENTIISPAIIITGDLTSEEDLLIEGSLDGTIKMRGHNVTVAKKGQVKADIHGNIIVIEGTVEGKLIAEKQLIIRKVGTVSGTIVSPRVVLEDGSLFNGSMEMSLKKKPTATTIPGKSMVGMKAT